MPFLVRWVESDLPTTIRCESVGSIDVLPDHLRLYGVCGLGDPDHPDLNVHIMDIKKSDIQYMAQAKVIEPEPEVIEPEPEPEIKVEAPKPKPKKPRSRKKTK